MGTNRRRLNLWTRIFMLSALLAGLEGTAVVPAAAATPEGLNMVTEECMVCEYPSSQTPAPGYHDDFKGIVNSHIGGNIHYMPVYGQCGLWHAPYLI